MSESKNNKFINICLMKFLLLNRLGYFIKDVAADVSYLLLSLFLG